MNTKKVKIMDIVIDPNLQVREVNSNITAKYTESMRAGNIFPPLIIDEKNRLICGHNRLYSYKRIHQPDYKIDCEITPLKNDVDLIMLAASDNARHGEPLTTYEKKLATFRLLKEHKVSPEKIAEVLGVTSHRIEEWAGISVTVIGKNGKKVEMPVKRNFEFLAGETVKESDYKAHQKTDQGVSISVFANQIISILRRENKWIKDPQVLKELYAELKIYFNKKGE